LSNEEYSSYIKFLKKKIRDAIANRDNKIVLPNMMTQAEQDAFETDKKNIPESKQKIIKKNQRSKVLVEALEKYAENCIGLIDIYMAYTKFILTSINEKDFLDVKRLEREYFKKHYQLFKKAGDQIVSFQLIYKDRVTFEELTELTRLRKDLKINISNLFVTKAFMRLEKLGKGRMGSTKKKLITKSSSFRNQTLEQLWKQYKIPFIGTLAILSFIAGYFYYKKHHK
jgi:hypothetical protein